MKIKYYLAHNSLRLFILLVTVSLLSCNGDKRTDTKTKQEVGTKRLTKKLYKLKLIDVYMLSSGSSYFKFQLTNNTLRSIEQASFEVYLSGVGNAEFPLRFKDISPGSSGIAQAFKSYTRSTSVNNIELKIVRFMVEGSNVSDAIEQIEIEPNSFNRTINLK